MKLKDNRTVIIVVIAALVFTAAIVISFYLSFRNDGKDQIVLPDSPQTSAPVEASPDVTAEQPFVSVSPANVKSIISTLSRPKSYYRKMEIVIYYENYSGGSEQSLATTVEVWQAVFDGDDEKTKIELENQNEYRHVLISDGNLYMWNEGSSDIYIRPYNEQTINIDELQMTLSYEEILNIPDEKIIDAAYTSTLPSQSGERCLYVVVDTDIEGYYNRYWISLDTGLLIEADTWNGDEQRSYTMSQKSIDLIPANGEEFEGKFDIG